VHCGPLMGKRLRFHTFTLPEDRCLRLLVKNMGKGIPEIVVREDLESLDIHVQGIMQLGTAHRDQNPVKDRPPTPQFIIKMTRRAEMSRERSLTGLCALRVSVETYTSSNGPLQCKHCQDFGHTQ
jgi:hypothetical protein